MCPVLEKAWLNYPCCPFHCWRMTDCMRSAAMETSDLGMLNKTGHWCVIPQTAIIPSQDSSVLRQVSRLGQGLLAVILVWASEEDVNTTIYGYAVLRMSNHCTGRRFQLQLCALSWKYKRICLHIDLGCASQRKIFGGIEYWMKRSRVETSFSCSASILLI